MYRLSLLLVVVPGRSRLHQLAQVRSSLVGEFLHRLPLNVHDVCITPEQWAAVDRCFRDPSMDEVIAWQDDQTACGLSGPFEPDSRKHGRRRSCAACHAAYDGVLARVPDAVRALVAWNA